MMTNRGELKQRITKSPGFINYLSHGSTTILVVLQIAREFRLQMNILFMGLRTRQGGCISRSC